MITPPRRAAPRPQAASRRGAQAPVTAPAKPARVSTRKASANDDRVPYDEDTGNTVSIHAALGERLKACRVQAGLTLAEVAERSGFGKSYLSRIENGKKIPPIASLARISDVLGVEPAALLAESGPFDGKPALSDWRGVSVVRHDEKRPTVMGGTAFGYNYLSVGHSSPGRALQAFLFSFPDKVDKYVFFEHEGEEMLHVLSGTLEWQVGVDKYIVHAGDTVHFDSSIPHRGRSLGGPAMALMVMHSPGHTHDELA